MKIMGIDFGAVRTGVAVCDETMLLASPVCVITEKNEKALIAKLSELAADHKVEKIVAGRPVNMDGSVGDRTEINERLARLLEKASGISVAMWDERLTTVSAERALNVTNTRGKKRKDIIDAVSAVIILEAYMKFLGK